MNLHLSILDQSPIISGHTPARAVAETVKLAQAADALGYHRYWLAEHHAVAALADPCPEILLTRVASVTARIRVGTGGVLLPYYSALKVAEVFRMLEALFPGRIDLGLGRAPGGDMRTAQALSNSQYSAADHFAEQVQDLVGFLDDALPADHSFAQVKAMPAGTTAPPVCARLVGLQRRARRGAGTALRLRAFHQCTGRRYGGARLPVWLSAFGTRGGAPLRGLRLRHLRRNRGRSGEAGRLRGPAPAADGAGPEHADSDAGAGASQNYTERELAYIRSQRARAVIGDPGQVRERLLQLRQQFEADELMILTITGDYASRLRSYELLAREFGLQ